MEPGILGLAFSLRWLMETLGRANCWTENNGRVTWSYKVLSLPGHGLHPTQRWLDFPSALASLLIPSWKLEVTLTTRLQQTSLVISPTRPFQTQLDREEEWCLPLFFLTAFTHLCHATVTHADTRHPRGQPHFNIQEQTLLNFWLSCNSVMLETRSRKSVYFCPTHSQTRRCRVLPVPHPASFLSGTNCSAWMGKGVALFSTKGNVWFDYSWHDAK